MKRIQLFATLTIILLLVMSPVAGSVTAYSSPAIDQTATERTAPPDQRAEPTDDPIDGDDDDDDSPLNVTVDQPLGHDHDNHEHGDDHAGPSPRDIIDNIDDSGVSGMLDEFGGSDSSGHMVTDDPNYEDPQYTSVCPDDAPLRTYDVHAVQVDIVYNKYGQHDPKGVMYVLDENLDAVRNASGTVPGSGNENASYIEPLVLRAHHGDCIRVNLTNHLDQPASMNAVGLPYNVSESDGRAVGYNDPSFTKPGESTNYTYYATYEGTHFFGDATDVAVNSDPHDERSLRARGLFGAFVIEPEGTKWISPERDETETPVDGGAVDNVTDAADRTARDVSESLSGASWLSSGTKAIIEDPNGPDHREFVVFYHDGAKIRNADGSKPKWPHSNVTQHIYSVNYRGDPLGARIRGDCPDCGVPEAFYSSWVHGDPGGGDLVFPTYVGDPTKYRLVGANVEENHVHHLHGHRWKSNPGDPDSNTIDAKNINPGNSHDAVLNAGFGRMSAREKMTYADAVAKGGAGYTQNSPGDYIFHCHLFPHYANGMWAIMRVHDKATDDLRPLPDREEPPEPTKEDPGYPNYIAGEEGTVPPKPPNPNLRPPTDLEESAINGSGISDPIVPGAPYADPCPKDAEMRYYNVTVLETEITYNNYGDYDPNATVYALTEDVPAIRNGSKRPEPLTLRAEVGDCVRVNLTNQLPPDRHPNEISIHIHFVGYDVQGSDGVTMGYNYDEGARPGEEIQYRWYADEEGTIFFHDHLSGFETGMHGTQGALVVEPEGSKWLDPYTGEPVETGTDAMIVRPGPDNDFREQVLFYQDFARVRDAKSGRPLNGPFTKTLDDQGLSAINYANAPLFRRASADPAFAYSSWVHGDPKTPLIEAYTGDPVRVRLIQSTFEEQHNFALHNVQWDREVYDTTSASTSTQTIGVSEKFEFDLQSSLNNEELPVRDYMYGSMVTDDQWTGMWGLFRVWNASMTHLEPLPDYGSPYDDDEKRLPDFMRFSGEYPARINDDDKDLDKVYDDGVPGAPKAGDPCPDDATEREYRIVAFRHELRYNSYGDHDPHGIAFATREQYQKVRDGKVKELEPLVIRANEGDCIELRLENELPENPDAVSNDHPHALVPEDGIVEWNASNRVSLHPSGKVTYDVLGSDGAAIGANFDSTVAPGDKRTYRWYAAEEGSTVLTDMADVRSHRHHGAFAMLVVEPEGSTWHDPVTGDPIRTGTEAVIETPDGEDFREFALLFNDGMYIVNENGKCPVPTGDEGDPSKPCNQAAGDFEEQGFKSVNFGSEPFRYRFEQNDSVAHVFSSRVHGDPNTAVLHAAAGERVVLRIGQGADRGHGMSVQLSGHEFRKFWQDPESPLGGVTPPLTPGVTADVEPRYGAGGYADGVGDYLLNEVKPANALEGGLWTILRVHDSVADVRAAQTAGPAAPTDLGVKKTNAEGWLHVTWDGVADDDVVGYNVYRSDGHGDYVRINDRPLGSTHTYDGALTSEKKYYYVVTAVDADGNESEPSNVDSRKPR